MFRLATQAFSKITSRAPVLSRSLITISVETLMAPTQQVGLDPKKQLWFAVRATGQTENEKNTILQILNQSKEYLQNSGIPASVILSQDTQKAPVLAVDNASIQAIIEYVIWKAICDIYKKQMHLSASSEASFHPVNHHQKP